ncbi:MAG: hypothetical protein JW876_06315 [Candidatus Krumholzibacteriota bacterium]|nr:hypothetical protein [Candidatus Krumholzibacteriota bacterium]
MRRIFLLVLAAAVFAAIPATAGTDSSGRIYGTLTAADGEVFEGLIRWDTNEASWVDILDGNKDRFRSNDRGRRRGSRRTRDRIEFFGIRIEGSGIYTEDDRSLSGICFGHIASLEVIGDDEVALTLKSGDELEFSGGSTDIGDEIRGIVIEDAKKGEVEFDWEDVDRIDFSASPPGLASSFGDRLYGTLTTRSDDTFTGWVCWDVDELFTTDELDGRSSRRRRHIEFGDIRMIERKGSDGARLTLWDGNTMVLSGSNDVDDSNRGIAIFVEGFGRVTVRWDEFESLEFLEPPAAPVYGDFDGGRRIMGTVYTTDGGSVSGAIRWDDDEEYTWEYLDGEFRDIEMDIEFANIAEIRRKGFRSAIVSVWDGPAFRLRGSNDVDEDNRGIFVTTAEGEEVDIDWEDLDRVVFSR